MFEQLNVNVIFFDPIKKQFINGKWVQGVPSTIIIKSESFLQSKLVENITQVYVLFNIIEI